MEIVDIPNGATNGDAMKLMFPNAKFEVTKEGVHLVFKEVVIGLRKSKELDAWFSLSWWNSPYGYEASWNRLHEVKVWFEFYTTYNDNNDKHAENAFVSNGYENANAGRLHEANVKWAREIYNHAFGEIGRKRVFDEASETCLPYFLEALYGLHTNKEHLIRSICSEYRMYDVELSSSFFNVFVSMPKKDILNAYAEIQRHINGDVVCRVENGQALTSEPLVRNGEFEDAFTGNCKDFLESFNKNPNYTRICDSEYGPEPIDFIL